MIQGTILNESEELPIPKTHIQEDGEAGGETRCNTSEQRKIFSVADGGGGGGGRRKTRRRSGRRSRITRRR